jgi:hypothetical protein
MRAGTQLYYLDRRGAALLSSQAGKSISHAVPNPFAPTVQHDLLAIELLASLLVEARANGLKFDDWCDDREMHRRLHAYRAGSKSRSRMPVPDASVTLNGQTFHIEVLRAPARGGNRGVREKLLRYVRVVHNRQLSSVYKHRRIRAVLLATATGTRAASLQRIVASLPRGRQLFWAGRYNRSPVLTATWTDGLGQTRSIANAIGL